MHIRYVLLFLTFFTTVSSFSQDYNYVHYDTRDGLAGSTVYDMCQDKDGFMWFATENGLSRYDGTYFTNFTVKDGLPDNEILKVFADSKGRVWIGSLSKQVSFYYKGKIYNKENTPMLADSRLMMNAFVICEDQYNNIAISDYKVIVEILPENKIFVLTDLPAFKSLNYSTINIRENTVDTGFIVSIKKDVYKLKKQELKYYYLSRIKNENYFGIKVSAEEHAIHKKSPSSILSQTIHNRYTTYASTVDGAWSIDTVNNKLGEHFLPGKKVSRTINDKEANTWFSTLGEGVFKLPTREMKTFHFEKVQANSNQEVYSITQYQGDIIAGLSFSKVAVIERDHLKKIEDYGSVLTKSPNALSTNRLYTSFYDGAGSLFLGFDGFLLKKQLGKTLIGNLISIKSISEINRDELLVGNYSLACVVRKADMTIKDTLWRGRCTDAIYHRGNYYFGTTGGLYKMTPQKQVSFLGEVVPELSRRIIAIKNDPSGKLYIATADKGLVILYNDNVMQVLDERNGLSSKICKSLLVANGYAWLGTNKGLHKIDLENTRHIVKYSASDGLPSDIINAVYTEDSIIWVGTPEGLTFFNENKISSISSCNLLLLDTRHNGKKTSTGSYKLSYNENEITFKYIAISQKSFGGIEYYYQLAGFDSNYFKTNLTELSFLSLPPGNYHLKLYAVNKFGKTSNTLEVDFFVTNPFWKSWWFYLVILAITSLLTAWMLSKRNERIRKRLSEINRFQKQSADLEQQALQSQMNPHFIFNCLNSIQQYMLTNDKDKANQYLSGFAALIRQTLDISTRINIPITEEVEYLRKYLEMEKMRFGEKFDFEIKVTPELMKEDIMIPPLLLQPYVENALRHGIRYKDDGPGKVQIIFSKKADNIICRVIDNGVGRKKAAELKGARHIEYQSKGMQLTAKRIRLINMIDNRELESSIKDLVDDNEVATGTEVVVKIPLTLHSIAN